MRFTVDRLDHLVLNCKDVEITASWYQRVLGMEREEFGADRRTALKFGGQKINIRPHDADIRSWHTGAAVAPGSADLCFITAVGPPDVIEHLHRCGVQIAQGPVAKTGALGPITSVYCRDPDGNLIEISSYLTG
jgi:catechol 2,3-dioxygenase-like lactoylglutathione lyase family enzyme